MYRLLGDNHALGGLPFTAQVFLRALDGIRSNLADAAGITGTELSALSRVAEASGIDTVALGDFLELGPELIQSLVDGLEERGLISTSPGSTEPDAAALTLTPAGHALIAATYESFQQTINTAADSLDPERRASFESGMLKMTRKLDAAATKSVAHRR